MKKNLILILALSFTAASCNSLISGGSGLMGVFRSDDSGDSFHAVNNIDKKNTLNSTSVNSLVFDPNNSQTLYLASGPGLYKTTDAGENWKLILTNILVADVVSDSSSKDTIYVVGSSNSHGKVVKTTDGGGSWKDMYTEPTTSNAVTAVTIDPTNHLHIIAGLKLGEVIHSVDGGVTWQLSTDIHDQVYRITYGPNKHPYLLAPNNGLYESNDNGKTFALLTSALSGGYTNPDSGFSAVSKFFDLAFDVRQSGVFYVATDVGLVRTVNDGAQWAYMTMPVKNSVLRTSAVAVNPKDSNNIYAVVGNTMFKSINGGITWETKPLPTAQEVRQILIDQTASNVIYLSLGVRK
jgi:photosystem II stability/assembly factor-like uncharacterized protein